MPVNEPIMPTYPTGKVISVTINEGESLGAIAARYNTSVQSIMKANGIKDADRVQTGQVISVNCVSNEELAKYNELKAIYDNKMAEKAEKEAVTKRTKIAASKIEKANKDGYAEDYDFAINNKGHILITLKNEKKLGEISEDFGLEAGMLRATNPSIEQRYKPVKATRRDGTDYETYSGSRAKKGDTFVIDTNDFTTERTWSQFFKDGVNGVKAFFGF